MKNSRLLILFISIVVIIIITGFSATAGTEKKIFDVANKCHKEVVAVLNGFIDKGTLSNAQLFDTFYIPVSGTNPKKFHTQYDKYTDIYLQPVIDKYLSGKIIYVIAVDYNGYVPTHNKKFSMDKTGLDSLDVAVNRTKRIFNDRTGISAARNTKPYLLQSYNRDTGEIIYDYSIPIYIKDKHWGALRVGYIK